MIIIHHNKDMDGYASGAICKLKYPDAKLIGWDYSDKIPDFDQFVGQDVIMIDITFPIEIIDELTRISRLTVIDHHISFKKAFCKFYNIEDSSTSTKLEYIGELKYIYEDRKAACEIGWEYLFPELLVPYAITLIGRYDTWRQEQGDWEGETLPFKYYMYGQCISAESFPLWTIYDTIFEPVKHLQLIQDSVRIGKEIMQYQETMDRSIALKNAFEVQAYGMRAIAINYYPFSSETLKSVFDPRKHDLMIGYSVGNDGVSVSLRSIGYIDVSVIAKQRGGGGHKNAAGFSVDKFENIFK